MTREEQIQDATAEHRDIVCCGFDDPIADAQEESFIEGAKWADEHPLDNVYSKQQLLDMGFAFTTNGDIVTPEQSNEDLKKYLKYQKQKFIDKACEWLNSADMRMYVIADYTSSNMNRFAINKFISDFRKAMEE